MAQSYATMMTNDEKSAYDDLMQIKRECLNKFHDDDIKTTDNYKTNVFKNATNSNMYNKFISNLNNTNSNVKEIFNISNNIYAKFITDLENTEQECNKQWNSRKFNPNNNNNNCLSLMKQKIDHFHKFDTIIKQFEKNFLNYSNTMAQNIDQFTQKIKSIQKIDDLKNLNTENTLLLTNFNGDGPDVRNMISVSNNIFLQIFYLDFLFFFYFFCLLFVVQGYLHY